MKYIVSERFKGDGISGYANIPAGTECESNDGFIIYDGNPICRIRSETAHRHFVQNEDGNGVKRGKLIKRISTAMRSPKTDIPVYDLLYDDGRSRQYRRTEHGGVWLWDESFYGAPLEDLEYIASLIHA